LSKPPSSKAAASKPKTCGTLGPLADLESHLPTEWWRELFGSLYLKTDGDVVENDANTVHEIDSLIQITGIDTGDRILDLCCGQGRHTMELAKRGYRDVTGVDRSRYLVRLARRRARDKNLKVTFREADARKFHPRTQFDTVIMMGNSFGYFDRQEDDLQVLMTVRNALHSRGTLVLDITDGRWMRSNFEPRSWEWIDQTHFVCRERSISDDGHRLISREVVTHAERGVIADQFYAERLYSFDEISALLTESGFQNLRLHGEMTADSDRGQDLGMMAQRLLISATAPRKAPRATGGTVKSRKVTVIMGDPSLPDPVKKDGVFNAEDMDTIQRLMSALDRQNGYTFEYLDNHSTLLADLQKLDTDLVLNLCDEGYNNNAQLELHVPAVLEMLDIPYSGAGPGCLSACYDKALVRAIAAQMDIPVPLETYVNVSDVSATLPSVFPALLKPAWGDSSIGITQKAVVHSAKELMEYLSYLQGELPGRPVLVQEFLQGAEFSVGLIGNPSMNLEALPILEVDFSQLDTGLPHILGYESKWHPDSPYWSQIHYRQAELDGEKSRLLVEQSSNLFERLGCRDYARFDFRADADGTIKLLEVNPNPGWCWDGKLNLMAGFAGHGYTDLLNMILTAACERIGAIPHATDRYAKVTDAA